MKEFWQSITTQPYRNLPWIVWFYAVLSAVILYKNGVFTGHIIGFDDQVRMTQVLDWVNGSGFYDRTIMRVNAPEGFTTIWSRLVDMPIALIVIIAQQFVPQKVAALMAATIIPLVELAILFVVAPYFARPLLGKQKARLIVLFLMFTSILNLKPFSISGFFIGQVSHHPYYIILNLSMLGAVARLVMGSALLSPVVILAASVALFTAVGIEGYPLMAGAAAILAFAAWAFHRPAIVARGGKAFVFAALGSLILLPLHQPPANLLHISFAEPSIFGVILVSCAAVFLIIENIILRKCGQRKLVAASILALLAAAIIGGLIYIFPQILQGGAAALSPAERKMALQGHPEGMPVHIMAHGIIDYIGLAMPVFIALAAGIYGMCRSHGRRRALYFCYFASVLISGGMSEIYSRYYHHAMTTCCAWLVWVWEKIKSNLRPNKHQSLLVFLSFIALGPLWMLLVPAILDDYPFMSQILLFPAPHPELCDALPISLYLNQHYDKNTSINVPWNSAAFLYYSDLHIDFLANYPSHDKFIDNYHFFGTRNANEARSIAIRHGFDLVAVCRFPILTAEGIPISMQTLVTRLQREMPPPWLKKIDMTGVKTNYILYAVDKQKLQESAP